VQPVGRVFFFSFLFFSVFFLSVALAWQGRQRQAAALRNALGRKW
jgi:hypothetical protein